MRNILMTVMMILVVIFLFTNIVTDSGGIKDQIEEHGTSAKNHLSGLSVD